MAVHVLDDYYLVITLLVTIAYQLFFFSIAFSFKFDKLTDFAGGTNFVVLAILTLALSGAATARAIVASVAIMLWGARLSAFLLFRILKTGKDDRFDDKRDKFFPFLGFWVAQMLWVWVVSLPVTLYNSPAVQQWPQRAFGTGGDIVGVILFVLGLVLETVADAQKYRFRSDPSNKGRVCTVGTFAWSRHPNYFGEILVQFGIYALCANQGAGEGVVGSPASIALILSVVGPLLLTILLMFVSGLPLQERPGGKKRYEQGNHYEEWATYVHRTSILIPFPPQLYAPLPTILKRTLFLEFPLYVFDPAKHADASQVQARDQEEGRPSRDSESGSNSGSRQHIKP